MKSSSLMKLTISFAVVHAVPSRNSRTAAAVVSSNGVELLPAVNLLDLRVSNEVQVEDDQLSALLELRANPVDRDRQRGKPGDRVVQHLLKLDALDAIGDPGIRRQPAAERWTGCGPPLRRPTMT